MGRQNFDAAAYIAMKRWFAIDQQIRDARNSGFYVLSGLAVTPSATAGKVAMAAGVAMLGTTELTIPTAIDPINFITALPGGAADPSNDMWVLLELDSSGTLGVNAGTPLPQPLPPIPTAGKVPLSLSYVPAGATLLDVLFTAGAPGNTKAKIIDCREVIGIHPPRTLLTDTAQTNIGNATSLTTLLAAAYTIPANSMAVGDVFEQKAWGALRIAHSTTDVVTIIGGIPAMQVASGAYVSSALPLDATNFRRWTQKIIAEVLSIGSGTSAVLAVEQVTELSVASATTTAVASAERMLMAIATGGFNSTANQVWDLQARQAVGNASSQISLRGFSLTKTPA